MGKLISGETLECLISGLPVDLSNVKLFVFVTNISNILAKYSIDVEEGFLQLVPITEGYTFTLNSETTALKSSGILQGEIQLFYTDGRVRKEQFTFSSNTITESVSPNEVA
jgi:hypothetical protein